MDLGALQLAARCGNCEQLQAGLRHAPASARRTLLTTAANWGHLQAVRLLLRAIDDDGWSQDAGKLDSNSGANIENDFLFGATALHLAIRQRHYDIAKEILASNRDLVNVADDDGVTPLADCCQHQAGLELTDLLLRWRADPNLGCRRYGRRPLHWAASAGDRSLAQRLIEFGADPGAQDWRKRTAADVAAAAGHLQLERELRRAENEGWQQRRGCTLWQPDVVSSSPPERLPQQQPLLGLLPRHQQQQQQQPQQTQLQKLQQQQHQQPLSQPSRHQQEQQEQQLFSQLPRHQQQQQQQQQQKKEQQLFSQLPRHQQRQQQQQPSTPNHLLPACPTAMTVAASVINSNQLVPEVSFYQQQPEWQRQQQSQQSPSRFRSESEPQMQQLQPGVSYQQLRQPPQPKIPDPLFDWDTTAASLAAPTIDLSQSQPTASFQQQPCPVSPHRRFTESSLQPLQASTWAEPAYPMSAKPRGLCLVFSNEDYTGSKLLNRPGTSQDVMRIEQLFEGRLGFIVEVKSNLTGQQMLDEAAAAAKKTHRHRRADIFVCFILAHGDSGGQVYGVDGFGVSLNRIAAAFDGTRCQELASKPKVFLVQACRGNNEVNAAATVPARTESDGPARPSTLLELSPKDSDFLYGFACCEDHPAYRRSDTGSLFIQTLCDVLEERLTDQSAEVDVDNALMETRRRIAAGPVEQVVWPVGIADIQRIYMVPEVRTTLRMKLKLSPCEL